MAGNADVIREYLVSLGFKIDQSSLNKLDGALAKTAKGALAFATTLLGIATATTAYVEHIAQDMENLYWASKRLRDGVANIQDFQLGISKVGGTAEGALSALEGMATFLRTNPAAEGWLRNLGVQTRDAQGNLRGAVEIVRDFAKLPIPYWLKANLASRFGIDEKTLLAITRLAPKADDAVSRMYKSMGINADDAAKQSMEFENTLRDLWAIIGVGAVVLETKLLPAAKTLVGWVTKLVSWLGAAEKATKGWSTATILLNAVWIGLGLAFGWIPATIVILGILAAKVIANWDSVSSYIGKKLDWLRGKYNIVAKFLGLPQWGAGAPSKPANDNTGKPVVQAPGNDNSDAHGATGQPLGVRYNNPGNLQPGGQERRYGTPAEGLLAMANLLIKYAQNGRDTVASIISKYAPPGTNNTAAYIARVVKELGVGAGDHLNLNDPSVLQRLMEAMIKVEQGFAPYSHALVGGAAQKALEGAPLRGAAGSRGAVTIHQNTDIKVSGTDPASTGREVGRQQDRVNGDLVRNFAGAQQ